MYIATNSQPHTGRKRQLLAPSLFACLIGIHGFVCIKHESMRMHTCYGIMLASQALLSRLCKAITRIDNLR